MISEETMQRVIEKSAAVAYSVLGLDNKYSVKLINDPAYVQDGLFGSEGNEVIINLATLKPYPQSAYPLKPNATPEEAELNKDIRLAIYATYVVFHEMRHLYQKRAVEIYLLNRFMGSKSFPQLESDKKCAIWEQELKEYKLGDGMVWDIEEDADAFANYLIHRYPTAIPMKTTNRRIGALKRKYDKKEVSQS